MDSVFILWHCHKTEGSDNEKLLGVYKTHQDAEAAIDRLKGKSGFKDAVEGFEVHEYVLGEDNWTEGYVSWDEAMSDDAEKS